ncbi:glycoside hydrolase family 25 protein [Yoonia sp.]|uniref:glycoside hydrolase family 25 protein n=1 Tax=Yoonia sp. TaxID=2212373 RepID=UPI002600B0B0|nr:glycoside hydrolase family 25 protein [Yoonia sp.]
MQLFQTLGHGLSALIVVGVVGVLAMRPALPLHTPPITTATQTATPPAATQADQTLPGIDVSHYQGDINWTQVAADGLIFSYHKATDGITYSDPRYHANRAAATSAGLLFGAYHFYEPNDAPLPQAQNFVTVAGVGPGSLPPVVDLERAPPKGQEAAFAKDVETWLNYVEQATGCAPVVYASPSFWNSYLDTAGADRPLWLASYGTTPNLPRGLQKWTFWQYSPHGSINGIKGFVDRNTFAGGHTDLANLTCP